MKFLNRILGIKDDPTAEWPQLPPCTPEVNLATMTVGGLRFGAPLIDAKAFGKPDKCKFGAECSELLYARGGFSLEFEAGVLSAVTFYVAREVYSPDHPSLVFSRPNVTLPNGSRCELNETTTAELLVEHLGKSTDTDMDDDEALLYWQVNRISIEAELFPTNRLKRLSLWPTQEE